jgi:hypothetical protein
MAPDDYAFAEIARTQLYFIDACRAEPQDFKRFVRMEPTRVFDDASSSYDDRCAPIYLATLPGALAFEADEGTLFGQSVLRCLDGGAGDPAEDDNGEPIWQITARSLERGLSLTLAALTKLHGAEQPCIPGGNLHALGTLLVRVPKTPLVELVIEILPTEASDTAIVEIVDETDLAAALPTPIDPHPHRCMREAGMYVFRSSAAAGGAVRESSRLRLDPPIYVKRIPVP